MVRELHPFNWFSIIRLQTSHMIILRPSAFVHLSSRPSTFGEIVNFFASVYFRNRPVSPLWTVVLFEKLKNLKTSLIQRAFLSFQWKIATSSRVEFGISKRFLTAPCSVACSSTIITCKYQNGLTIRLFLCCFINLFYTDVHCTNHCLLQGSINQSRPIIR